MDALCDRSTLNSSRKSGVDQRLLRENARRSTATHGVTFGQFPLKKCRIADYFPDQVCGTGLAVKILGHGVDDGVTGINRVLNIKVGQATSRDMITQL